MLGSLWQASAAHQAEQLLRELQMDALPICPFSIALKLDIEVRPLPSNSQGVSGMLLRHDSAYGILYATYLNNQNFERFSVSHELGHYCLPGHPESILVKGLHKSHAGFISKTRYELEADHFAAGLLMPGFLFNTALDKAGIGLDAIETLASLCTTSLTATAIRYAQCTSDAVAIIVSTGHQLDYCFMSDSLKEVSGLDWLRKGTLIPQSTVTHAFNNDPTNIAQALHDDDITNLQDWFGGNLEIELLEEVIGLGSYGRTLTVLSTSNLPDQEEQEEEEELTESWTPRFRR